MLKIKRPLGRLSFNMGIAIPGKTVFLIETAPRTPFQYKYRLSKYGISIIKIRRSWDRFILVMGIPIQLKRHIYTKTVHNPKAIVNNYSARFCLPTISISLVQSCSNFAPSTQHHIMMVIFCTKLQNIWVNVTRNIYKRYIPIGVWNGFGMNSFIETKSFNIR